MAGAPASDAPPSGKYGRKAAQLERRLTFLVQSFSFSPERLDEAETQLAEMEDLTRQLGRNVELLEAAEPESVQDHQSAFAQLNAQVRERRERLTAARARESLLSGATTRYGDGQVSIEMQKLLEARESVHKSQQMAAEFLEQTGTAKDQLSQHNSALRRVRDKSTGIAGTFSAARNVLGLVWRQKTKNTVVLGLVAGCCLAFLIWWKFG